LHGDNFDQASKKAIQISKEQKLEFIEAFDDPFNNSRAGHCWKRNFGPIDKNLDVIFVPVGGGGLIGGYWCVGCSNPNKD